MVTIVQLSETRKKEISKYPYEVDWELVRQCAYYPLPTGYVFGTPVCKCGQCSFKHPNQECNRSHILVDTRIKSKKRNNG